MVGDAAGEAEGHGVGGSKATPESGRDKERTQKGQQPILRQQAETKMLEQQEEQYWKDYSQLKWQQLELHEAEQCGWYADPVESVGESRHL